jgi:hypothetical protein
MIRISFLSLIIICAGNGLAQPIILPPTQTDEIIIDNGSAGKAYPNDRIRYKVAIQHTGSSGEPDSAFASCGSEGYTGGDPCDLP